MTKSEFLEGFISVWQFREDLEDGLVEELEEIKDEFKMLKAEGATDYQELAYLLNGVLANYGYPSPLEVDVC